MAAEHLLEHGDGAQARGGSSMGTISASQIAASGSGRRRARGGLALGGQPGIGIEPGAGAGADACPGGGDLAGVGPAMVHVQSRLLVGDVRAGHEAIPWRRTATPGTNLTPPQAGPRTGADLAGADLRQGYAQPPVSPGNHHPD